jgi:hypothetical protein
MPFAVGHANNPLVYQQPIRYTVWQQEGGDVGKRRWQDLLHQPVLPGVV